ncbi:polysaccharide pyruvyl transferase family protein [Enterococcus casseliflavus]|nr:polysaccharide pyruvyl transferase family protein [Enterococcus casseliflavus]
MSFSRTHNYGSQLQCFALQSYLKSKFNVDSEFINFSNDEQREMYAKYNKLSSFKILVKNLVLLKSKQLIEQHYNDFESFSENYLVKQTEDYRFPSEINYSYFDKIIVGSDQVWNINARDFDEAYYLNFAKDKQKIAYACSMGALI